MLLRSAEAKPLFYRFVQLCWTLLSLFFFFLLLWAFARAGSGQGEGTREDNLRCGGSGGGEAASSVVRTAWQLPAFHESYARVGLASKVRSAGLSQSVEREWSGWWQQCARWLALSRSQQGPVSGKTDAGWQAIEAGRGESRTLAASSHLQGVSWYIRRCS